MVEYIDVYDEYGHVTGQVVERGTRMEPGRYQMYATAIIQDTGGRYLITRRSLDKSWGAGWWEFTGGGVPAGETVEESIVREIGEEVGLACRPDQLELLYRYRNDDPERGDNYFMNIFRARLDFALSDVVLQAEEAIDCRLAAWDEIEALNEQGVFLHYRRAAMAIGE